MSTYAYPNPQAIFYQQYNAAKRDEVVGILLALFLGSFGVHHFYLRRTGLGILYACFFWSGIPGLLGFIECFFMPGRVREFNSIQAAAIAASLGIPVPGWPAGGVPPIGAVPGPVMGGPMPPVPPMPPAIPPPPPTYIAAPAVCARCQYSNAAGAKFCAGCGSALG